MNRCTAALLSAFLLSPVLQLMSGPADAQVLLVRNFPAAAQRGVMQIVQPPEMVLNGLPDRLSPGAQIRDPNNMLVMSGSLVGMSLNVEFVREPQGMVHRVWILTDAEAAAIPMPPQYGPVPVPVQK